MLLYYANNFQLTTYAGAPFTPCCHAFMLRAPTGRAGICTSRDDEGYSKNERETTFSSDFSGTHPREVKFAGHLSGVQKRRIPYVNFRITQRNHKNQSQVYLPTSLLEHKTHSINLLRFNSLKTLPGQREGSFFGGKVEPKLTRLTTAVRLENSCGAFSIIGEINCAQQHCLQKFINLCMKHGKKNKSYKIISNTLQRLILFGPSSDHYSNVHLLNYRKFLPEQHSEVGAVKLKDELEARTVSVRKKFVLLMKAIENVKPIVEVKKVRISGTTQLVPSIIPKNRQICVAIRWIVEAAILRRNTKKSMSLDQCFFAELIDASQNIGTVRKRRDDLHKLVESNRGFAHYRWW